ncbi:reductive dehalogenase [Dehalogenimonas etheniformans]|nr:reductive dehalogenase [Dehalogenimonas etheniformans]
MKALGITSASLGAMGMASPVFHDLDEMSQSGIGSKRPWYVKENEPGKLTVDYDWALMKNPDQMKTMHGGGFLGVLEGRNGFCQDPNSTFRQTYGIQRSQEIIDKAVQILHDGAATNRPGYQVRDLALNAGAVTVESLPYYKAAAGDAGRRNNPKWQGTPEEAAKMVWTAGRFYGASDIRTGEITDQEKVLFFTRDLHNVPIVFEDSEIGYSNSTKRVIPNKKYYSISVAIHMSKELFRYGYSPMRYAANLSRYRQWRPIQMALMNFISTLGYDTLGYYELMYGVIPAEASALLFGHSEISRNDNFLISPDWGSVQGYFTLLTTLPLAQSKPIDAGISRFCNTCKKCAESCPQQCISYDNEPSWDIPNSKAVPSAPTSYTTPGKKTFHTDAIACMSQWVGTAMGCGFCMGNCVFNVNSKSMIHQLVKPTVSALPILNHTLRQADVLFGYGLTPEGDFEKWWDMNLPVYGTDSTFNSTMGGYNK